MLFLIVLLLLATSGYGEIKFESLGETTIYSENLGTVRTFTQTWNLIIGIDTSSIDERFNALVLVYRSTSRLCKKCPEAHEIDVIRHRINRLDDSRKMLKTILGNSRLKKGIFNFVGDIYKTLFGTLDEDDLKYIDNELDKLFKNNEIMGESINNQTRIIKSILNYASLDINKLEEFNKRMNSVINSTNDNTNNIFISSQLTNCMIVLTELSEDINTLIDVVNGGKHGIIHPQVLTTNQ